MKTIFLTIATLFSISAFAQNKFESDLSTILVEWNKGNHSSEANFKQLINDYPNEWLPKYYLSLSEILKTFESNDADYNEKILSQVKEQVEDLVKSNPLNTEILNLKALYLTAEIVQNPMQNGAVYYGEVLQIYQKSLALNPTNPRSVLGLAEFNINSAKYSGMDITQDCKNVKKSLALFDAEKPKNNEPKWGKNRAQNLLNNECKTVQ
ncbi:tetratricopeptide repeat protein [Empedobacter stercoris]|uniref:tetratricopeptide repeat protein n=1 Tax=Empedobacter stercoris TaxID=1628248 RepID=UPI0039ED8AFB